MISFYTAYSIHSESTGQITDSIIETLNNIPKRLKFNQSLLNNLLCQYSLLQKSLPSNHKSVLPVLNNPTSSNLERDFESEDNFDTFYNHFPDSLVSELDSYGDNVKTAEGIVYMSDGNNLRVVIVRGRPLDIGCVYLSCAGNILLLSYS